MGKLLYEEETGARRFGLLVNFAEASLKWERLTRFEERTDEKQTDLFAADAAHGF